MLTLTEENYIKAIFRAEANSGQPVSTKSISEIQQVNAASVTDMFKKLSDQKLVIYEKSRGVKLTDKGRKCALMIVRKHRLWETFLVEKLKFAWDEVHDVAEQLEHINSDLLIEKLDALLNYPKFDPHGDPIPDVNGKMPDLKSIRLSEAKVGAQYKLCGVTNHSQAFLKYLNKIGITLGDSFEVKEIEDFDHSVTLQLSDRQIVLSKDSAGSLMVL
jgi:DtxR family transcriptional regulator, Mn-dependent transcriptional regulator